MSEDTDLSFQNLEKGLSFCTKEDAEKYMKLWCDKHLFPLVVRGSFKGTETINGRIQYTCPHGVQRKTISTGERPLQHVLYTGCLAMVTITQNRQGNVWWVSKVHKEHSGHMCGAEVYGSYQTNKKMSDKDYQMITELESVGASRRRVASALSDKTGNVYSTKDVYNAVSKLNQNIRDSGKLEKYLANVQLEGGCVNWHKNESGEVSVLWVQTRTMISDVSRTKPWVWQTDTTFSTNREGYKLYIPLHKSAVTGRFQVSGLLFLATENRMNVSKGLTFFQKSLPFTQEDLDTRFHFLVDKDFDYIEVLHLVFPGCRVLLDSVHVERYFRDKVFPGSRYMDGSVVQKSRILKMILSCRDSHTPAQYNGHRQTLMQLTQGLYIRPGRVKHEVSFGQYYNTNWESITPMWVLAFRKKLPLQGSDSTQAVESFFRALKLYQSQEFGKRLPTLTDLIPSIAKAIDQQFGNRQRLVENKRTVYQHADSNINSALEAASWDLNPTGIKLFYDKILMYEKRREHISIEEDGKIKETYNSGAKVYETDEYSCSCSIFAQYFFCRHMVFFRIETNLPIFDIRAFHTSLHKTNSDLEVHRNNLKSQDMSPSSPGVDMVRKVAQKSRKPRTQANKYNTGFDVAKEMAEVICVYEEETFKTYLECSQNFVRLLRRGLPNNVSDFLQDPDKYDVVRKSDRHELLDHNIDVMKNCSNDFQNKSLEDPDIQTNHTGLKHPTQEMEGNQPGKRPLPIGFREIPGRHQGQFSQECIVKTIKATGGCGYGAVAYKLYNDEDLVLEFRKSCHQFLLRVWDTMNWASFVTYPFRVTIIVGQGESVDFMIKSEEQYLDFLQTEQSLTSFSETNIEVQNICNMLNITIHVFTYNSRANSWYTYEPMQDITRFSEYAYPTNDGLNTVVLYHEEDAHFELIVPRYKALSSAIGQPPVTADVRSENYTVESFNTSALASFLVDNGNYEKFRNPSITSEDKCVNQSMSTDFPPPPVIQTSHSGVFRTSTLLSQSSPFDKAEMSDELPNISIDLTQNTEQTEDFGGLKLQTVINKRGRPKRKREGRNALPKAKRKKFSNFLDDLDSVFEENETFSSGSDKTKIKRKRGRPFKTISDTLHSSSGSSLSMKRKRGRPLKGLNSSRVSSEPSVKVKRKRGRPFKGLSSSGLSSHPSVKDTSDVFKQPYDYETGNLHYSSQSSSVSSYQRSSTGPFRAPNTMKALNRDYPTKAMDDSLEEID